MLAVLEAMKMQIAVRADLTGVVSEVLVAAGRPIVAGDPVVRLVG